MKAQRKVVIRYSEAFKQQVIEEVESGRLTVSQARRKYGIKADSTIPYWIKRRGKLDLLPKIVRVEKPNERSRIKELEEQVRRLKEALADSHVRELITETQFEIVCKQQGLDPEEVKKKLKEKRSSKA